MAKELNLSVVFHCRVAHKDLIAFLKENQGVRPEKAVAHGFVGNLSELQGYLNFGYSVGFNGIIFKKIEGINFEENIKFIPLDRMVVETDAPYLSPPLPVKALTGMGQIGDRNEPLFLKYIVEEIARIKNLSYEEVAEKTTENARRLFNV